MKETKNINIISSNEEPKKLNISIADFSVPQFASPEFDKPTFDMPDFGGNFFQ